MCRHDGRRVSTGSGLVIRSRGRLPWATRGPHWAAACRVLRKGPGYQHTQPRSGRGSCVGHKGSGLIQRHFCLCFQTHRCLSFSKEQFTKLPIPHEYYFKLLNQQGLSGIPTKGKKSNTERNHVNPCKTKAILHGFRRTFPGTEGLGRRLEWQQLTLKWTPEGFRKILGAHSGVWSILKQVQAGLSTP